MALFQTTHAYNWRVLSKCIHSGSSRATVRGLGRGWLDIVRYHAGPIPLAMAGRTYVGGFGSVAQSTRCWPCARGDPELGERSAERSASIRMRREYELGNCACVPKGAARCDGFRYCTSPRA
eukprot:6191847-Pleurochrysis_carterae.AAC.1